MVQDLISKIKALDLDQFVKAIKVVKVKKIIEHIYDHNNPPPAHMRNTKNIRWVTDKPGIYKKIETKIVNKFPGYIFIKMDLNDKVWLAIRNSFYVTGFVGSSGKGAKPIPISDKDLLVLSDTLESNKPMEVETQSIETKTSIYDETEDAKIHE
ncbi:transcription termination/antitermination protein NusG [bacterium]|nr:transcription termination/antitermination protein NusG [bacterium]